MGQFTVGDVVIVHFPYADFTRVKKRPALVVGNAEFDNLILCQITSKSNTSQIAIPLFNDDFLEGSLPIDSYIRPDKLFTVEVSVIDKRVGVLETVLINNVRSQVRNIFT